MLNARCPLGGEQVDESAARVNGTIVTFVLGVTLLTGTAWPLAYLVIDFAIKLFVGFAVSPNCFLARAVADLLRLPERPGSSAPKRFAALLGLVMSTAGLAAAYLFGAHTGFMVITTAFAICAVLESVVGLCVGCLIYSALPGRLAESFVRTGGVK